MWKPRDILKRERELYVLEQVVERDGRTELFVRELESDRRWILNAEECERVGRQT